MRKLDGQPAGRVATRGAGSMTRKSAVEIDGPTRVKRAGLTVINARHVCNRDGRLIVTVPETVEASADDLAPALQAA
jgi:hypothetical protein